MAERAEPRVPDYYAVLGTPRDADLLTIKRAYRRLALAYHPDRHPGDASATPRFQRLVEAYDVLGDAERRKAYDAGRASAAPPIPAGTPVEELLGRVVDGLFGVRRRKPKRGRDREYRLGCTLAEVARGTSKLLRLPADGPCTMCDGRGFPLEALPEVCGTCAGTGETSQRVRLRLVAEACPACGGRGYEVTTACASCEGSGVEPGTRDVRITVPAGTVAGERLRVRGAGEPGVGAPSGDLYVVIEVEAHPLLARTGDAITMALPVSVFAAMEGAWVQVPTVEGLRKLKLPPGVSSGTVLRMPGLGVGAADGPRGDQLVTVDVELPAGLDQTIVEALRELAGRVPPEAFPRVRAFEDEVTRAHRPRNK